MNNERALSASHYQILQNRIYFLAHTSSSTKRPILASAALALNAEGGNKSDNLR